MPIFQRWKQAIEASEAVTALRTQPAAKLAVERKYVNYLLMLPELWARSYAQYIASKSGDAQLLAQLDKIRTDSRRGVALSQWTDADFQPILEAMDEMFRSLGWLKKRTV